MLESFFSSLFLIAVFGAMAVAVAYSFRAASNSLPPRTSPAPEEIIDRSEMGAAARVIVGSLQSLASDPDVFAHFVEMVRWGRAVEDRAMALRAVSIDGMMLRHLSVDLQDDLEIVSVATRQNPVALFHGGPTARDNDAICVAAVSQIFGVLNLVSDRLRSSRDFVQLACAHVLEVFRTFSPNEMALLLLLAKKTNGPAQWIPLGWVFEDQASDELEKININAQADMERVMQLRNRLAASVTPLELLEHCIKEFPGFAPSACHQIALALEELQSTPKQ